MDAQDRLGRRLQIRAFELISITYRIPRRHAPPRGKSSYRMFKSVFAKYVITFTTLLAISFLLLLFIVNSVISRDSLRTEKGETSGVASSCADHLADMYRNSGAADLGDFICGETPDGHVDPTILRVLSAAMTNHSDMTVYVTDASGGFIFCTGYGQDTPPAAGTLLFSEDELARLRGEAETAASTRSPSPLYTASDTSGETADGSVFLDGNAYAEDGRRHVCVAPVTHKDGSVAGYVMVTSLSRVSDKTVSTTLRSMTVAALWIMLAALIAIYIITERVISPLRDMSRAAKRMAVGQFDLRVPVRGKDEVAQLAVAFNQMAGELDNLERMRNSFVANVSHDLRTPMTTIAGFIDGILDGVIPPEQTEHYLKVVSDEVRRLSRLVTALLDVSRLQAGDRQFDVKPFDICEMGRQILISFEQKITDKRLDVEFVCDDERMFVLADRDSIHQILYNITDNAVKFSSEQGKLKMTFAWSAPEGGRRRKAVVKVFNEGQGIPAEDLPFVFERFYKSDKSRSLDKSGVGLGMFISKTIIDAHGESISVASEYGKNCEFTFTLARTEPPAQRGR